jgi:hypothetical protein
MLKSVRSMTISLLLIGAAVHANPVPEPAPEKEWRLKVLIEWPPEYPVDTPVLIENRQDYWLFVPAASGTIEQIRFISGAPNENPPTWHARFTPLQENTVSQTWAHPALYLQPYQGLRVEVRWIRSRGKQMFELYRGGKPAGHFIKRERLWYDPREPDPVVWEIFNLHAPPGGEPPPGGDGN